MKNALVSFFILFRLLIFSQEISSKQIFIVKDTMITDRNGLIWNCILNNDNSSEISFYGYKNDSISVKHFYSDKMGTFFLKKVLRLDLDVKKCKEKMNVQIISNNLNSLYTETFQAYKSSSPKNNKLTLNNYYYLNKFFSEFNKNDIIYSENSIQLGYGIEYELDKTKLISVQIRFNNLPSYETIIDGNYLLDELDFYLYFSIWKHKE